jgi:hypothetical protein
MHAAYAQVCDSLRSYNARRASGRRRGSMGGLEDESGDGASDDGSPMCARTPSGSVQTSSPSASMRGHGAPR